MKFLESLAPGKKTHAIIAALATMAAAGWADVDAAQIMQGFDSFVVELNKLLTATTAIIALIQAAGHWARHVATKPKGAES